MDKEAKLGCWWALALVLLSPVSTVFKAWVATVLWGWFIVPAFNLPTLSIWTAMGMHLLLWHFLCGVATVKTNPEDPFAAKVTHGVMIAFGVPLFVLCSGWVIHSLAIR